MSIDSLDPNLMMNPPVQTEAQQVEPIKEDTVSIQKEKLENKKSEEEARQKGRRRRRKQDKVELSTQRESDENAAEQEEDEAKPVPPKRAHEHRIDIVI
jgi:hypothetical protein